ncbi:RFC checkpoint protein Rad17 [Malassezia vespertilionis]|uniref:RFC checkpoint protein Rad17 n=1 Tax=Malassezia vespertilionis TaxID=2020962 RepID=UPI0024B2143E|nr:RFC checkpoint protein Rad17 [Malassezia vespertilionis]WFD08590.1 RFC checkpoint protein Rad17 [Malassezia vespertilionis]
MPPRAKRKLGGDAPRLLFTQRTRPPAEYEVQHAPPSHMQHAPPSGDPSKRKVDDVQAWLAGAFDPKMGKYRRMLALTGPSGAGKTATVRALAKADALDFEIVEWENKDGFYDGGMRQSAIARFAAFVHAAQRYPTLPLVPRGVPMAAPRRRKIVLVEDLPNLAHEDTRAQFHAVLEQLVQTPCAQNVPIVCIISDSVPMEEEGTEHSWRARREAQMDVRRAIPPSVRVHSSFAEICFNPMTARMIQSALLRAAPAQHIPRMLLNEIASGAAGDVRGAVNTLALAASGRHMDATQLASAMPARATSLALFHALGRVLYNKREGDPKTESVTPPKLDTPSRVAQLMQSVMQMPTAASAPPRPWLQEKRTSLVNVDAMCAQLPVDASTFVLYLHHNMPQFTECVEECAPILDALSAADTFEMNMRAGTAPYGLLITMRAALLALPSPVPRRGQVLTKPAFWDCARRQGEIVQCVQNAHDALHGTSALCDTSMHAMDARAAFATESLPWIAQLDERVRRCAAPFLAFSPAHTLAVPMDVHDGTPDFDVPSEACISPRTDPPAPDEGLPSGDELDDL